MLWLAWASYSWLGNVAKADEGVLRLGLVAAVAGLFAVALAVPEAFENTDGGVSAPLVLALGLTFVRLTHLAVFAATASGNQAVWRQIRITSVPVAAAGML